MKNCDKQNLIISIESSIDFIESHLDSADKSIAFILKKHGVRNLEKASIYTLQDLFSELYAIEADLRYSICPEQDIKLLTAQYRIT